MIFKKTNLVLILLVLMVAAAAYLNWNYQNDKEGSMVNAETQTGENKILGELALVNSQNPVITDETLKSAKQTRDTSRSKAIETYNQIIANPSVTKEAKDKAQAGLNDIAKAYEREGVTEGLLKAKGVLESVVFISEGSVSVILKTEMPLDAAMTAKFFDVIVESCKVPADKIKITEVK